MRLLEGPLQHPHQGSVIAQEGTLEIRGSVEFISLTRADHGLTEAAQIRSIREFSTRVGGAQDE